MKRPSFQFYPGDWLQDPALRACSLAARGLWIDMIAFMHQGSPYGHLTLPGGGEDDKGILRPIQPVVLARMVGGTLEEVEGLLSELEAAGVFSRTEDGIIFSRRMVQDEKLRETRASGGIKSLDHPNVQQPKRPRKDTIEGSLRVSLPPSFGGSPSSSSSSSKTSSSELQPGSDEVGVPARKKTASRPSKEACGLTALLKAEIIRNKADYKITSAQERRWAVTAQRMLDLDKRTEAQIADLIGWVQNDEFWRTNVLSMDTLRAKFDQLEMKRLNSNRNGYGSRKVPVITGSAVENTLALLEGRAQ